MNKKDPYLLLILWNSTIIAKILSNCIRPGMSAKDNSRNAPVIRQAENLDENRIVLYKRSKQLGQGYYIVEISSNNTHLFIAAYDVESPESLLIELPEKRA